MRWNQKMEFTTHSPINYTKNEKSMNLYQYNKRDQWTLGYHTMCVMQSWKIDCYYFANILWGPCVKSNWHKGCVGFKGLGMSLKTVFYLGFYFISYSQFCIRGDIFNFCYSCKSRVFWYSLVKSRIFKEILSVKVYFL